MCYKRYHIIFSTFFLKFKCKICVRKQQFIILKSSLVTWPATEFLILSKWCRFKKNKSLLFCLRDYPLIVFRRQNHVTFIFKKTMSHDLLVQVAYSTQAIEAVSVVRVVCDRLGSVSIWSSRSFKHFLRRLGRSVRSYGNQALLT